jgi:hypothetical protein
MNNNSRLGKALVFFLAHTVCAAGATVQFNLTSPQDQCTVVPGAIVHWTISVSVSGGDNAGLALLSLDLEQDPTNPELFDIQPASAVPTGMENLSRPEGVSNPGEGGATTGYIGVQRGNPGQMNLVQIGGGQNNTGQPGTTIGTSADVVSGIGQGTAQIIAEGTIVAPGTLGTYRFSIANPVANVLDLMSPPPQPPDIWPVSEGTVVPGTSEFSVTVGTPGSCLLADINGDTQVNGIDIQPFIDLLLSSEICLSIICPADTDIDGDVDLDDIPLFVGILLGQSMDRLLDDCNNNGVPDANDIANGTSGDCNNNFIPDECDIDPADPDGDGQVSNDLNTNTIPDECEPDCNENAIPDDKDISDGTSTDINGNSVPDECETDCNNNSVPDEWDISQGTSEDCNANGWPDECEYDCNANGVPDACDIDPSDPDGDGEVSEDCQPNGLPDECDFTLPLMPSADCNENGIPDECDIADGTSEDCNNNGFPDECDIARPRNPSPDCNANGIPDECDLADCPPEDPACQDCNVNGIPDECDIASGTSQDENTNGIPDECEGGGAGGQGGGGAPGGGPSGAPTAGDGSWPGIDAEADPYNEAAWAEFFAWFMDQAWGPDAEATGAEQHQMMVDKLEELGLPIADPWQ